MLSATGHMNRTLHRQSAHVPALTTVVFFICIHWWQSILLISAVRLIVPSSLRHFLPIAIAIHLTETIICTSFFLYIVAADHWLIVLTTFAIFWNNGLDYLSLRIFLLALQVIVTIGKPIGLYKLLNRYLKAKWPTLRTHIEDKMNEQKAKHFTFSRITLQLKSLEIGPEPPLITGLMFTSESFWPMQPKSTAIDVIFVKDGACNVTADCDLPMIGTVRCRVKASVTRFAVRLTISRMRGKLHFNPTIDFLDDVNLELQVIGAENTMINWMLNPAVIFDLVLSR